MLSLVSLGRALAVATAIPAVLAGCERLPESPDTNQAPETALSALPPVETPGGYRVELSWSGNDPDGDIAHWEIAVDDPEDWSGPLFATERTLVLAAPVAGAGEPADALAPRGTLHSVWVRAVDQDGLADPTPARVSFDSGSIAPTTFITHGPSHSGIWGPDVEFEWEGQDDDGVVVSSRWALTSLLEFEYDHGAPPSSMLELIAWVDTLTFRPLPGGGYSDEEVWVSTTADSVLIPGLPASIGGDLYAFAVRSVDDSGLQDPVLLVPRNARAFRVVDSQDGPRIHLFSDDGDVWGIGDPPGPQPVFAGGGLRFEWNSAPGPSGSPVTGFRYAVDDSTDWSPWSPDHVEWPAQIPGEPEVRWFPGPGIHTLWIEAIDAAGLTRRLEVGLEVYMGPQSCPLVDRTILVVLDTDGSALIAEGILPSLYPQIETALALSWLDGVDVTIHSTAGGVDPPGPALLNCASSVLWIHTADLDGGDHSALSAWHESGPNLLPGWIRSGGNLFLTGVQPGNAVRWAHSTDGSPTQFLMHPLAFENLAQDPDLAPHWMWDRAGVSRIEETIGYTVPASMAADRLRRCNSEVAGGAHPYPDLHFDPLRWPNGPEQGGFGYYDRGLLPGPGTQILYTADDTGVSIAARRLVAPGPNGNVILCGFHPYFLQEPDARQLFRAVLTDFGERLWGTKRAAIFDD